MNGLKITIVSVLALFLTDNCAQAAAKQEAAKDAPKNATVKIESTSGKYNVQIDITDVIGHDLPTKLEFVAPGNKKLVYEAPKGHTKITLPAATYKTYIYVYCQQVPVLVDVQDLTVKESETAFVLLNLLEGSGERSLFDFDQDCDFAIDNAEMKAGTKPDDASSIPGKPLLPFDDKVIQKKEGWYRGELHAHSSYGAGKESVAQLVKRAEKLGLDFLAITDLNTIEACKDPGFKSDSVVLIPAMEWGIEKKGVALVYGPKTFPEFVDSKPQAQALVDLVQAQGGFFAVAHPCFPTSPWLWGLGFINGVEIWCREWNAVPPMALDQLPEDLKERKKGKLIQSIAFAAASDGLSANGQASVFYDCELVRGLKAAVIGGSNTADPAVPMASPVTYVYAIEKSVKGILNGMRRARTFVSSGLNGPTITFDADVLKDKTFDASYGGIIPLGVPTHFVVCMKGAKDKEVQILLNGHPFISKSIDTNDALIQFDDAPDNYSEYRVRIVGKPQKEGFASLDVYAITSPIFAQDINLPDKRLQDVRKQRSKETVRENNELLPPPQDTGAGQIIPKWRF